LFFASLIALILAIVLFPLGGLIQPGFVNPVQAINHKTRKWITVQAEQ
jgi:hypothetical protein